MPIPGLVSTSSIWRGRTTTVSAAIAGIANAATATIRLNMDTHFPTPRTRVIRSTNLLFVYNNLLAIGATIDYTVTIYGAVPICVSVHTGCYNSDSSECIACWNGQRSG